MLKSVHVAVGVILSADKRVLIALRNEQQHQGGLWEFPGGKVEVGESVPAALARELEEELAIVCDKEAMSPLIEIRHDYPDKKVHLDIWLVEQFTGIPKGNEGQQVRWAAVGELSNFSFPEANQKIVELIQERYS